MQQVIEGVFPTGWGVAPSLQSLRCDTVPLSLGGSLMPAADNAPDGFAYDAFDQLRHDLKTPLTTISACAQVLERTIRRSPALAAEERAQMLAAIIVIERLVREMVAVVDGIGDTGHGGRNNPG